jgi:hypothetical protein
MPTAQEVSQEIQSKTLKDAPNEDDVERGSELIQHSRGRQSYGNDWLNFNATRNLYNHKLG